MEENNDVVLLRIKDVDMEFKIPALKFDTLKERVVNLFKRKKAPPKRLKALENIN